VALTKVDGEGVGTLDSLNITESNNGATEGPSFELHRNSASPADNDVLGALLYTGKSSTGADKTYSSMNGFISNVANANASGGLIFSTRNSDTLAERMRIDSSGNLLVGKTDTSTASQGCVLGAGGLTSFNRDNDVVVRVRRDGTDGDVIEFFNDASKVGSISLGASSTAYNTSSDYRLKENVVADWDATTRLKQLNPVRFNFIADADTTVDGFLAHEVQSIVPEAITGTKDAMRDEEYEVTPSVLDEDGNVVTEAVMGTRSVPDYQGIDQGKLVPLLVKTIQELEARITALETE